MVMSNTAGSARNTAFESRAANRVRCAVGFTLVELLIVLALISILAAMGVVQYRNGVRHTQESVLRTDLFRMRDAIDQYYADKNKYPASLDTLVSDGYMRKIPEDPITQSADTWQTVAGRARSEQSDRGARDLRRQERRAGYGARRVDLCGLVGSRSADDDRDARTHALDQPVQRDRRDRASRAARWASAGRRRAVRCRFRPGC